MSDNSIKTYRTKEDAFLLIIIRLIDHHKNLVFLVDPWKVGIRDFTEHNGKIDEIKTEIGLPNVEFHEIPREKAAQFLKIGYNITKHYDIEISEKAKKWLKRLGVLKLKLDGSLYRCFNCETGNLSEEDIEEIEEIVVKELDKGVIGTDKEEQFFYICDTCKEEMHDSHQ